MTDEIENLQIFLSAIIGLSKSIDKSSPSQSRSTIKLNLTRNLKKRNHTCYKQIEFE